MDVDRTLQQDGELNVLWVTAIQEEKDAAVCLLKKEGKLELAQGFGNNLCHRGKIFENMATPITVGVFSFAGAGEDTAAIRTTQLLQHYKPEIAVMTGVCAGHPKRVDLGDVVVAERAMHRSAGKETESGLKQDISTIEIPNNVKGYIQECSENKENKWRERIPNDIKENLKLQMRAVYNVYDEVYKKTKSITPSQLKESLQCDDKQWESLVINPLLKGGVIRLAGGMCSLSDERKAHIDNLEELSMEYLKNPEPRVLPGVLWASPTTVVASLSEEDWNDMADRLGQRQLNAGEMESVGFLRSCQLYNQPDAVAKRGKSVIPVFAKGVMDFAGSSKNDEWKPFAAHASAAWVLSFLKKYHLFLCSPVLQYSPVLKRSRLEDTGIPHQKANYLKQKADYLKSLMEREMQKRYHDAFGLNATRWKIVSGRQAARVKMTKKSLGWNVDRENNEVELREETVQKIAAAYQENKGIVVGVMSGMGMGKSMVVFELWEKLVKKGFTVVWLELKYVPKVLGSDPFDMIASTCAKSLWQQSPIEELVKEVSMLVRCREMRRCVIMDGVDEYSGEQRILHEVVNRARNNGCSVILLGRPRAIVRQLEECSIDGGFYSHLFALRHLQQKKARELIQYARDLNEKEYVDTVESRLRKLVPHHEPKNCYDDDLSYLNPLVLKVLLEQEDIIAAKGTTVSMMMILEIVAVVSFDWFLQKPAYTNNPGFSLVKNLTEEDVPDIECNRRSLRELLFRLHYRLALKAWFENSNSSYCALRETYALDEETVKQTIEDILFESGRKEQNILRKWISDMVLEGQVVLLRSGEDRGGSRMYELVPFRMSEMFLLCPFRLWDNLVPCCGASDEDLQRVFQNVVYNSWKEHCQELLRYLGPQTKYLEATVRANAELRELSGLIREKNLLLDFFVKYSSSKENGTIHVEMDSGKCVYVDISGCGLKTVPAVIPSLSSLLHLDMSYNRRLRSLPAAIGSLTALQRLNLHHNQLSYLPAAIDSLTALQQLDLGNNQLSSLPAAIGSLTALEELYLQNNPQLDSRCYAVLGRATGLRLQWLWLRDNPQLKPYPSEIGSLPHLSNGVFLRR